MYTGQANSEGRGEREQGEGRDRGYFSPEKGEKNRKCEIFTFLIAGNRAAKNSVGV